MSISMSEAKIDDSSRTELLQKKVDTSIVSGGVTANRSGPFGLGGVSGAPLAGITPEFAKNVTDAIDSYVAGINEALDELENPEVNQGFRGTALEGALNKFVSSVKSVAQIYCKELAEAENQILRSVETAYNAQDESLTANLSTDSDTLSSSAPTSGNGSN